VKHLIARFLLAGKLETAIDIYERHFEKPELLYAFTKKTFFNRARTKLIPFILDRSGQLDSTIAPPILRSQVVLAEMVGSTLTISDALKKFDVAFDSESFNKICSAGDGVLSNAANAALGKVRISGEILLG